MARKKKAVFAINKIVNCSALNVRSSATKDSLVLKVISKGTVVECDKNFKDKEWDHVMTDFSTEGFCMKQFLTSVNSDKEANAEPKIFHAEKTECDGSIAVDEEVSNGKKD